MSRPYLTRIFVCVGLHFRPFLFFEAEKGSDLVTNLFLFQGGRVNDYTITRNAYNHYMASSPSEDCWLCGSKTSP